MNLTDILYDASENEDPFNEVDPEKLAHDAMRPVYSAYYYFLFFTEIVKLLLSFLVLFADIYVAKTIYTDRKKKSKTNRYIMHYAACHILLFVSSPFFYFILDLLNIARYLGHNLHFIIMQIEQLSITLGFFFAAGLGLEWLIEVYNLQFSKKIGIVYNHLIPIFYVISFSMFLIQFVGIFFSKKLPINYFTSRITLLLVNILLISCNCLKYRTHIVLQVQKEYPLTIANIIVLTWTPLYLFDILLSLTYGYQILHGILLFLWFIPEWVACSNPIIIMLTLGKLDIYFQSAYEKIFKRSVRRRDDEENLDEPYEGNFFKDTNTKNVHGCV